MALKLRCRYNIKGLSFWVWAGQYTDTDIIDDISEGKQGVHSTVT